MAALGIARLCNQSVLRQGGELGSQNLTDAVTVMINRDLNRDVSGWNLFVGSRHGHNLETPIHPRVSCNARSRRARAGMNILVIERQRGRVAAGEPADRELTADDRAHVDAGVPPRVHLARAPDRQAQDRSPEQTRYDQRHHHA